MTLSNIGLVAIASLMLLAGSAIGANTAPKVDTAPKKHPNLEQAQTATTGAFAAMTAAKAAGQFDTNGRAAQAQDLIDQAATEEKLAAEANAKGGK